MIFSVFRTAWMNLRRDRGALLLNYLLPVVFFSIFAGVFAGGGNRSTTPRVHVAVADGDRSEISQRLVAALRAEPALAVKLAPDQEGGAPYDAASAEAAVRNGDQPVALIIPKGFGAAPLAFEPGAATVKLQLLADTSDPVAPQMVMGLLQKAAMMGMPDVMAEAGSKYMDKWAGELTPQQRANVQGYLDQLKKQVRSGPLGGSAAGNSSSEANQTRAGGLLQVEVRDVLGQSKKNPVVAFYAAGIGVMFLLFTAANAGGALLEESESGTLDRILSTRVSMSTLLLGKMMFLVSLGVSQLLVMFVWGAIAFQLELVRHLPGFFVMAIVTAIAASAFGLLLATACRTRSQLGAFSTLVILVISALGGSMFPRFLMPESVQKFGLLTFNAWALDGFTKVFWREASLLSLWPQVGMLMVFASVFFLVARRLARRWELA